MMTATNRFFVTPLCSLLISLFAYTGYAYSSSDNLRTLSRTMDAVIIPGEDLPGVAEHDISNFRLLSVRNGTVSPILFQIDQRDEDDQWVWDSSSGAERTHDDEDPDQRQVFDDNDELVFIAGDVGDRITDNHPADSRLPTQMDFALEITVTDPVDGSRGWVYLVYYAKNPPALSDRRYVNYDKPNRAISADNYEFVLSEKHLAVMETLRLNGASILDRTKVRGEVELSVLFISTTIEFNEEEIGGYNEGYINGPVRLIKRSVNHLVIEGMDAPDVMCDHFFYPEYAELPIAVTMQFPVDKMKLRVTGDYFGGEFKQVFAEGLDKPISLTQIINEGDLLKVAKGARWMGLDGKNGSIVMSIKVPEEITDYIIINPWLVADPAARYTPESVPGADPEVGFEIKTGEDFPSGKYVLHAIYKFSADAYKKEDAYNTSNLLHHALQYQVTPLKQFPTSKN
jgi:hypothetical protein